MTPDARMDRICRGVGGPEIAWRVAAPGGAICGREPGRGRIRASTTATACRRIQFTTRASGHERSGAAADYTRNDPAAGLAGGRVFAISKIYARADRAGGGSGWKRKF